MFSMISITMFSSGACADSCRELLYRSESRLIRLVSSFSRPIGRQFVYAFATVIAVQNMEASGTVVKDQEVEFKALEGSLSMMSKGMCLL